jgi:hypothetical protein
MTDTLQKINLPRSTSRGMIEYYRSDLRTEVIPLIPADGVLGPGTSVDEAIKTKTPGKRDGDVWWGYTGPWSDELFATKEEMKKWDGWGAQVGLQTREYRACDIDDDEPARADQLEKLAVLHLGWGAPVRFRRNSGRRLLVYLWKSDAGYAGKVRIAYKPPGWKVGDALSAVEVLGKGQQFQAEGIHKSGVPLEWRYDCHPCDMKADDYPIFGRGELDAFRDAVGTTVKAWGGVIVRDTVARGAKAAKKSDDPGVKAAKTSNGTKTGSSDNTRHSLDDPSGWAQSPELVLELLGEWPYTQENLPSHDDFVQAVAAIKWSLGPEREKYYPGVLQWALGYPENTETYVCKTWNSIKDANLGWLWLCSMSGSDIQAHIDFAEPLPESEENVPPAPDEVAKKRAEYEMYENTVYINNIGMFGDAATGDLLNDRAFCVRHRLVAKVGLSGTRSADKVYLNNKQRARFAAVVTYRPGNPAITEEEVNGTKRVAFNTYRPPILKPAEGVTDADVAPALKHLEMLPEPADLKHFLDWGAFMAQNPGVKINHGMLLLGPKVSERTPRSSHFGALSARTTQPPSMPMRYLSRSTRAFCRSNS